MRISRNSIAAQDGLDAGDCSGRHPSSWRGHGGQCGYQGTVLKGWYSRVHFLLVFPGADAQWPGVI